MKFDFDKIIDRRGTNSLKWEVYKNRDILPLWVADMDFESPPAVMSALKERIEHGVFGYTLAPMQLTETVVERMENLYQWRIQPEWIIWLPGLVTGINVACRTVGNKGDGVVTNVPVYPPFLSAPVFADKQLITFPVQKNNQKWEFDFSAFEKAVTKGAKLFLLCSPHNPLGRIFSHDELHQICSICDKHDVIICSDEIHCELLLDEHKKHIPTAALNPNISQRTITLMAPSKTFNIPGMGLSFAIIENPELRKKFEQAMAGIVPHVNALGYTAALAAYLHGKEWKKSLLNYLQGNHDLVLQRINQMPGLDTTPVEATYLSWIDARETGIENPHTFFEQAGVGLSNGKEFGAEGFVRLNFGCSRHTLLQALERMEKALT